MAIINLAKTNVLLVVFIIVSDSILEVKYRFVHNRANALLFIFISKLNSLL